jgi:hypothetical protein
LRKITPKVWFSHCLLLIAIPLYAWGETHVKGTVEGVWSRQDNPYVVDSSLVIEAGKTLEIRDSVLVLFNGPHGLNVYGQLIAQGTEEDSIYFWNIGMVDWTGIWFLETSHDCLLNYVSIRYPVWGIRAEYHDPTAALTILHSNIYAQSIAIRGSKAKFHLLHSNLTCDSNSPTAISLHSSDAHIEDCRIVVTGITSTGVAYGAFMEYSQPEIWSCSFLINASQRGYGIWAQVSPPADISHNLIQVISKNYANGGFFLTSSPNFVNNTVILQSDSAFSEGLHLLQYSAPQVTNCIFTGDDPTSVGVYSVLGSAPIIRYSDFFNLTPTSIGTPLDTGCIFANPMFVDPFGGDFHLDSHSPCRDTGDPAQPLDPDTTRSDMGCFYYQEPPQSVLDPPPVSGPVTFELIQAIPNPFNGHMVIRLELLSAQTGDLVVFNQLGRLVATIKQGQFNAGETRLDWDAENLTSGVYWITLRTAQGLHTEQVSLIK